MKQLFLRLLLLLLCGWVSSGLAADETAPSNAASPSQFFSRLLTQTDPATLAAQEQDALKQWINEPAQKAIVLYDQNREDAILQIRYEGPDQEFGLVIPVPNAPEIQQAPMKCFYNLSWVLNEPLWPEEYDSESLHSAFLNAAKVKPVDIKTAAPLELTVIPPHDGNQLNEWLAEHRLSLPKMTGMLFDKLTREHWYFVVAKINPHQTSSTAANGLVSVEFPPVILSFSSAKCIAPVALLTGNAELSRIVVFALSSEPLLSTAIFHKKLQAYANEDAEWLKGRPKREKYYYDHYAANQAEEERWQIPSGRQGASGDPNDPVPPSAVMRPMIIPPRAVLPFSDAGQPCIEGDLVRFAEVRPEQIPACTAELPRLAGSNTWSLAKEVTTFPPGQLCPLEMEPAIPLLAQNLYTPEGRVLSRWLTQFGKSAVPLVLAGLTNVDVENRRVAASVMAQISDSRFLKPLAYLLMDPDPDIRVSACRSAAWQNWESAFAEQVVHLLTDPNQSVRSAAYNCLQFHRPESQLYTATYEKIIEAGGPDMSAAMFLLRLNGVQPPKAAALSLLASPDPGTFKMARSFLNNQNLELKDISPLLTNSSPVVRGHGMALLAGLRNKEATALIVTMLRDPDEGLRWSARNTLRMLAGIKLGAAPGAYEKWWAENKDTFTPIPRRRPPTARQETEQLNKSLY